MNIIKDRRPEVFEKLGNMFTCPLCSSEFEYTERDLVDNTFFFGETDMYGDPYLMVSINCPVCSNETDRAVIRGDVIELL